MTPANKPARRKRLTFWALCYFKSDKSTAILSTRYFEEKNVSVGDVVKCDISSMDGNSKKKKTFDQANIFAMNGNF